MHLGNLQTSKLAPLGDFTKVLWTPNFLLCTIYVPIYAWLYYICQLLDIKSKCVLSLYKYKKVWLALYYRALYKAVKAAGSNSFLIGHFVHKLSLCSKKGHLVCLLIQDWKRQDISWRFCNPKTLAKKKPLIDHALILSLVFQLKQLLWRMFSLKHFCPSLGQFTHETFICHSESKFQAVSGP